MSYDICPWDQQNCFPGKIGANAEASKIELATREDFRLAPNGGVRGYLLGGDNGYRTLPGAYNSGIQFLWKNYFAGISEAPKTDGGLMRTPLYLILGNHDYEESGCGSGCQNNFAAAGYIAFALSSSIARWYDKPELLGKCVSEACSRPLRNTYAGPGLPVDWQFSFGVYLHGDVAQITWDSRWCFSNLLSDSQFADVASDKLRLLNLLQPSQVWVHAHWDAADHGACPQGVSCYVASKLRQMARQSYPNLNRTTWTSFAGHTHVNVRKNSPCIGDNGIPLPEDQVPTSYIIGANGYGGDPPCPTVAVFDGKLNETVVSWACEADFREFSLAAPAGSGSASARREL
jgi:hypothetical protein